MDPIQIIVILFIIACLGGAASIFMPEFSKTRKNSNKTKPAPSFQLYVAEPNDPDVIEMKPVEIKTGQKRIEYRYR